GNLLRGRCSLRRSRDALTVQNPPTSSASDPFCSVNTGARPGSFAVDIVSASRLWLGARNSRADFALEICSAGRNGDGHEWPGCADISLRGDRGAEHAGAALCLVVLRVVRSCKRAVPLRLRQLPRAERTVLADEQ